jgi:hypothetical protein
MAATVAAVPQRQDADEENAVKPSMWPILIQAGLLYALYTWRSSSKPATPAATSSVGGAASSTSASDEWLLSATATFSATPTPVATGPLSDFAKMFDHVKDAASGRKKVAPELQARENARLYALGRAQRAGGSSMYNAWLSEAQFDVTIFLAESAEGITDFSFDGIEVGRDAALENKTFDGFANAASHALAKSSSAVIEGGGGADESVSAPFSAAFWRQTGLLYSSSSEQTRTQHFNISLPPAVLANMTRVYAHVFFSLAGAELNPDAADYKRSSVIHAVVPLIKYLKRKPVKPRFSLMGDSSGDNATANAGSTPKSYGIASSAAEREALAAERAAAKSSAEAGDADGSNGAVVAAVLPYWKPTLHLQLVHDHSPLSATALPPGIPAAIDVVETGKGVFSYTPHFYANEFWLLGHHLVAVNETTPVVPLTVSYSPVSMWRWALEAQMTSSWEMQSAMGTAGEGDTDMIKSILVDTNPLLLGVTVVVSLLHSIFDFLAFRNDISFWRSAKSLEGLSVRTVAMSVFFQGVIFLYLLDFGDTSYMILFSTGAGVAIEAWKLLRAMGGKIEWQGYRIPKIDWGGQTVSYAVSKTQEYDSIATGHLLFIMYPLIVGYAGFSLFNDRHRSWYSWILSSLVSFIYMFGFAQMVPQLYINYRLKSVAHLPWKTMSYKFLNTIIDDLFAFVVKMPSACDHTELRKTRLKKRYDTLTSALYSFPPFPSRSHAPTCLFPR